MEILKQKRILNLLKGLAGFVILVLLIFGIKGFMGSFKISLLREGLKNISIGGLFVVFLMGLIAFMPMCFYDFLINKKLNSNIANKNIFKYGWIVNAVTIVAGLGDAAGITLRTSFYKNKIENKKKFLKEVSRVSVLNPTGLSILAIIYLLFYSKGQKLFSLSGIIVILVSLYIPIIIIYNLIKHKEAKNLEYKYVLLVVFASFLDWFLSTLLFFTILRVVGVAVSFNVFFPIYILAMILGIASMLPGAIGAFDLSILIGLTGIGIPKEFAVLSLFLYRVSYYIIPLIIAGILFVFDFWNNTNAKFKGTIGIVLGKVGFIVLRGLVFISGAALLLSNSIPQILYRIPELEFLSYATEMHFSKFLVIIVGFLLIVMSSLLKYKAKYIHYLTVVFLVVGMLLTIMKSFNYVAAGYLIIVAFVVTLSKKEFTKESFVIGIETIIPNVILLGGFWIIYLMVAYLSIPLRVHKFQRMIRAIDMYKSMVSFSTIGFILALFMLFAMFLIGKHRNKIIHKVLKDNMEEVRNILDKYNGTSLTHLIYLEDKYIYLSEKYEGLIQYSVYSNKLMVLGNPIGNNETLKQFIEEFYDFADSYGYIPIFFEVSGYMLEILHEFGYEFMKLGEAAVVDVQTFTIAGQKMQKVRTCCNKINREGYSFEVVEGPFTNDLMKELKEISDKWLNGRKEMGFSMGFFNEEYINKGPLGVVRNNDGVLKAFVTIMPTYGENKRFCSDLMRFSRDTPRGVMDYMFVQLLQWGKENGYESFDFGVAPLSNVGVSKYSFLSERLAYQLYYYGQKFYSFEGLKKFKAKYAHTWEPKFLAYKSKINLPITALQANLNVSDSSKKRSAS